MVRAGAIDAQVGNSQECRDSNKTCFMEVCEVGESFTYFYLWKCNSIRKLLLKSPGFMFQGLGDPKQRDSISI